MASVSNESQLQLTLQTFQRDLQLSIYEVIRLYNILYTILSTWINGCSIYIDIIANLWKLTIFKEEVIVREVFDLDSRGFPPRIHNMEDIANRLLTIYDTMYIELCWAFNFVKRQPEFYIYWNRPYNY